jgi:histidinol phosphatase-like PHP family hydrolase
MTAELDYLVDRIARAGVLCEINTAGHAQPWAKPIQRWTSSGSPSAGVMITFGSDAHRPEEVGRDFDRHRIGTRCRIRGNRTLGE